MRKLKDPDSLDYSDITKPKGFDNITDNVYFNKYFFKEMADKYNPISIDGYEDYGMVGKHTISGNKISKTIHTIVSKRVKEPCSYIRVDSFACIDMKFSISIINFLLGMSVKQGRIDGLCYVKSSDYIFKAFIDALRDKDKNNIVGRYVLTSFSQRQIAGLFKSCMDELIARDYISLMYDEKGNRKYGYYYVNFMKFRCTTLDKIFQWYVSEMKKRFASNNIYKITKCFDGFNEELFNSIFGSVKVEGVINDKSPASVVIELAKQMDSQSKDRIFPMRYKDTMNISRRTFYNLIELLVNDGSLVKVKRGKYMLGDVYKDV